MEYLALYCLFALTTAVTSMYEIVIPVIRKQKEEVGSVENKYTLYITLFLLALLIAPYMFLACIIPSFGESFRTGLQKGLFTASEKI